MIILYYLERPNSLAGEIAGGRNLVAGWLSVRRSRQPAREPASLGYAALSFRRLAVASSISGDRMEKDRPCYDVDSFLGVLLILDLKWK
ncbi:Protein of unknown function [Gryllus bimaculatus]|nr:Protein of unknown function [Gryllus bimaculatus]